MSKNRIVNCTVVNNTSYDLTLIDYKGSEGGVFNDAQGTYTAGPQNTLPNKQTTKAFSIQRSSSVSLYGSTGWVSYDLKNSQGQLVLTFNNPYSYNGVADSGNCWFYALIQGSDGGAVGTVTNVYATVSGITIDVTNPDSDSDNQDTMNITVTLNPTTPTPG